MNSSRPPPPKLRQGVEKPPRKIRAPRRRPTVQRHWDVIDLLSSPFHQPS